MWTWVAGKREWLWFVAVYMPNFLQGLRNPTRAEDREESTPTDNIHIHDDHALGP